MQELLFIEPSEHVRVEQTYFLTQIIPMLGGVDT